MPASFWTEELPATREVQKQNGDVIVVKRVRKGDKWFVDVRTWYVPKGGTELQPGKGLAIPADLASEIAEAIEDAATSGE